MSDSQTVKKTVMLAGRISPELKKRFAVACARRGWKTQLALERIITEWVAADERDASGAGYVAGSYGRASMLHEPAPGESVEVKRDRRKASKPVRGAR